MPLLAGRTDTGAFTNAAWAGFGDGSASTVTYTAAASGTADTLDVYITNFGANSIIDVGIYEQVGGAGDFNLIQTITVPSGAAPQQVTGLSFAITATNVYRAVFVGDNTSLDANAGNGHQIWSDPLVVSPDGVGSVSCEGTPPATLNSVGYEADGEFMWGLSGNLSGPAINAGLYETFRGTDNNFIPDADYTVWVTDNMGVVLVAAQTIGSVSGTITVDDQLLGAVDDVVFMSIRLVAETNVDQAAVTIPAIVIDLDA